MELGYIVVGMQTIFIEQCISKEPDSNPEQAALKPPINRLNGLDPISSASEIPSSSSSFYLPNNSKA